MSDSSQASGGLPVTAAVLSALTVVGLTVLLRHGWRWLLEAQPPKFLTSPSSLAVCMQRMSKFCKASSTFDGLLADFDFESCKPDPVTLHGSITPGKYLLRDGEVVDEGAVALLLDSLTGQVNYFAGNEGYVSGEMNIEWLVQASAGERLLVTAWIKQLPHAVKAERRALGERETALLAFELRRLPKADGNGSESVLVARGTQMQLCILTPWQRRKASLAWYVPGMRTYRWQSFVDKLVAQAPKLTPLSSLGLMSELLFLQAEKAEKPGQSCFSAIIAPRLLNVGGVAHGAATSGLLAAAVRKHCASELQEAQTAAAAEGRELEAADSGVPVRRMQIFFVQPVPANSTVKIQVSAPPNPGRIENPDVERVVNAVMKGQDGKLFARSRVTVPKLPQKKPPPPAPPRPSAPLMAGGLSRMPLGVSRLGARLMPHSGAGPGRCKQRVPSSSEDEEDEDDDTDSAEDRLERLQRLRAKLEGVDDKPPAVAHKSHANEVQREKQRGRDNGNAKKTAGGNLDATCTEKPVASKTQADVAKMVGAVANGVTTELEGCWRTCAGQPVATIKGSMIHWSDSGDKSIIKSLGDKSWLMVLDDESHIGELQADGRLIWNDGEIWIPQGFRHVPQAKENGERHADVAGDDDAPSISCDRVTENPSNGSPLDGEWSTLGGEPIATIKGDKILWAGDGGATSALTRLGDNAWSMELDDETHRGELRPDGRLSWSDGELWVSVRPV